MANTQLSQPIWLTSLLILVSLGHVAAWDYSANGKNWGGQCAGGGPQSPINLPISASTDDSKTLFLKYPKITNSFAVYHNGYSIALTLPESYKGGFGLGQDLKGLESGDDEGYRLWQINFHSPSEHTLQGRKLPLEMQMMHQRVTGGKPETAVVVVLFENGANSYVDVLDRLMKGGLPRKPGEETVVTTGIELGDIVGGSPFYNYEGSLTTPPCESSIKYYVRQEPIQTANEQLRRFHKVLKEGRCAPNGNFRLVHPHSSWLSLMSSVDVVKAPDTVVKPKASKTDTPAIAPPSKTQEKTLHCSGAFHDDQLKNAGRIRVGDTKKMIASKERYNRAMRELQLAEAGEGNAERALKLQQSLYANAPGVTEKINLKWGLAGAEAVFSGAKINLGKVAAAAPAEKALFEEAILEECARQNSKMHHTTIAEINDEPHVAPGPAYVPPKPSYPAPLVTLPTGLAASPFSDGSEEPKADVVGADEGQTAAPLSRISPNLHQPDVAESGSVTEAKGESEPEAEKEAGDPNINFSVNLPISSANMGPEDAFGQNFVASLAASVGISASRFEVTEVKHHKVAQVHGSYSFAQDKLEAPAAVKGTNLRGL